MFLENIKNFIGFGVRDIQRDSEEQRENIRKGVEVWKVVKLVGFYYGRYGEEV